MGHTWHRSGSESSPWDPHRDWASDWRWTEGTTTPREGAETGDLGPKDQHHRQVSARLPSRLRRGQGVGGADTPGSESDEAYEGLIRNLSSGHWGLEQPDCSR